jgi:signal peptidase I
MLLAGLVSPLVPGVGHFLVKRYLSGTVLLILFGALLLACWPLRLPNHVAGMIVLGLGMITLCIFATVHAPYVHQRHHDKPSRWWLVVLVPLAVVCASGHINWTTRAAGFQSFSMPSVSMENTVPENSRVIVDRRYYDKTTPKHGDIVVYLNPDGFYIMKRLIAMPGETIQGRNGVIFIDGKPISEPYVIHSSSAGSQPDLDNFGPLKIPPGKLFVMGDNRDISLDSRSYMVGPISIASLRGKALYVIGGFQREYKELE